MFNIGIFHVWSPNSVWVKTLLVVMILVIMTTSIAIRLRPVVITVSGPVAVILCVRMSVV